MDKTKYNRAAKDPSQLQNFVDEVCDGGAIEKDLSVASLTVLFEDDPGVTEVYPTYLGTSYESDELYAHCGLWSDDMSEQFAVHATNKDAGIEGDLSYGYSDDEEAFVLRTENEVGSGIKAHGSILQLLFEGNVALEISGEERSIFTNNTHYSFPETGGTLLVATNINNIVEVTQIGSQFYAGAYDGKLIVLKNVSSLQPPIEITFSDATALVYLNTNTADLGEFYGPRSGSIPCRLSFDRLGELGNYNIYIDLRDPVIAHVYCDCQIDSR